MRHNDAVIATYKLQHKKSHSLRELLKSKHYILVEQGKLEQTEKGRSATGQWR